LWHIAPCLISGRRERTAQAWCQALLLNRSPLLEDLPTGVFEAGPAQA
jgi:hypothetical protein